MVQCCSRCRVRFWFRCSVQWCYVGDVHSWNMSVQWSLSVRCTVSVYRLPSTVIRVPSSCVECVLDTCLRSSYRSWSTDRFRFSVKWSNFTQICPNFVKFWSKFTKICPILPKLCAPIIGLVHLPPHWLWCLRLTGHSEVYNLQSYANCEVTATPKNEWVGWCSLKISGRSNYCSSPWRYRSHNQPIVD